MPGDVAGVAELLEDSLGEHLAELDAHLVVRVDAPDGTLDVDLVLVQSNKSSKGARSELLEHDRVGRLVALEDLRLHKSLVLRLLSAELLNDLRLGLAERESPVLLAGPTKDRLSTDRYSLRLGKEVGKKNLVVLAAGNGVESLRGRKEVAGSQYMSFPFERTKE